MPSYLVETFLARGVTDERWRRERRASEAAEALTRTGTHVRFGGSIYVPDEEICFFTFDASSDRAVALVAERAGLQPFRVVAIDASTKGRPPRRTLDPPRERSATPMNRTPGRHEE